MRATISPFLDFYIRHALEVDELLALRDDGHLDKLAPEDRSLFDEVAGKATRDAAVILNRCLERGAKEFAALVKLGDERSDQKWTAKTWDVYWFFQHKRVRGRKGHTMFGVNIQADRKGAVFLLPYVGIYKASQTQLEKMRQAFGGVGVQPALFDGEYWTNVYPLSAIPLLADSAADDLVDTCGQVFRRVAPHLSAFARIDVLA